MNPIWFFVGFFPGAGNVAALCDVPRRRLDEGSTHRTRGETGQTYRTRQDQGDTHRTRPPECGPEQRGVS